MIQREAMREISQKKEHHPATKQRKIEGDSLSTQKLNQKAL